MTAPSITRFLLVRIAEDEAAARAADEYIEGFCDLNDGTHYSGDRIVAECAAKRAVVELCREDHEYSMGSGDDTTELASEVLYALAAVYADHPDYSPDWAL